MFPICSASAQLFAAGFLITNTLPIAVPGFNGGQNKTGKVFLRILFLFKCLYNSALRFLKRKQTLFFLSIFIRSSFFLAQLTRHNDRSDGDTFGVHDFKCWFLYVLNTNIFVEFQVSDI
ncbi:hypothetical protein SAMN05192529_105139 [Arachidicoccus rhizosphaerae]|uniref:Uncharacterized protein n=1 Tax=Arachidicoccus rhizosphaerae TaxID=551991 RepID=A0A1H3XFI6_9BACT|nr:hypothetical protein SAMN05192529_105139 [Arachidicoccus rhizosphaerae]